MDKGTLFNLVQDKALPSNMVALHSRCLLILLALAVSASWSSAEAFAESHAAVYEKKIQSLFGEDNKIDMRMEQMKTGLVEEIAQHVS